MMDPKSSFAPIKAGDIRFVLKSRTQKANVPALVLGVEKVSSVRNFVPMAGEEAINVTVLVDGEVITGEWLRGKSSICHMSSDIILSENCY